jgi:SpoVK/Ycf46/Vps4 family AAA+-type ATPase
MEVVEKIKKVWEKRDDTYRFLSVSALREEMEAGLYYFFYDGSSGKMIFTKQPTPNQAILDIEEDKSHIVCDEAEKFWKSGHLYKKLKKPFKRSFLLYGPPGTGKSYTINKIAQSVIAKGGLVLCMRSSNNGGDLSSALAIVREIEPEREILMIFEDIDIMLENNSTSGVLLNVLDGIIAINKMIFIGTTNYIEKLAPRVSNRPNRFDKVIHIGSPNQKARKAYLEFLLKDFDTPDNMEQWYKDTKGLSFAHLTELVTAVMIFNDPYPQAVATLMKMKRPETDTAALGF